MVNYSQENGCLFKALARLLKNKFLGLSKVVVEQDAAILNKVYANVPQKIKLNNEMGMDWVKSNFSHWRQSS